MRITLFLPVLCMFLLAGCSLPESYVPELRVTNDDVYVWDNEKSTALNLVELTVDDHKMRDSDRPKGQSFLQSAAGRNVMDLINYNLFGFSGLLFSNSSSKWYKPTYILLEEKQGAVPSLNYNQFMDVFVQKLDQSLSQEPGLKVKSYNIYRIWNDGSSSASIFLEGDVCVNSGEAFDLSLMVDEFKKRITYGPVEQTGFACEISVVVGKIGILEKDNSQHWTYNLDFFITNETIRQALFENAQYFDGYAAFPVKYAKLKNGEPSFPLVFEGDTLHYFIEPE